MATYYVNNRAQENGDHEVHKEDCLYLPLIDSKENLGNQDSCFSAVRKSKTIHFQSNGCRFCSEICHTS